MGSKWSFLLMYDSHDMRHIGFSHIDGGQRDPRDSGRHIYDQYILVYLLYLTGNHL